MAFVVITSRRLFLLLQLLNFFDKSYNTAKNRIYLFMYFLAIFSYKTSIEAKSAIVTSDHPDMHKEIRESENPLFSRFDFLLTPPSSGNRKSPPRVITSYLPPPSPLPGYKPPRNPLRYCISPGLVSEIALPSSSSI